MEKKDNKQENKKCRIYYLDAGGCNGCYLELIATVYSKYDPDDIDIDKVGSAGQADIVIVTGPVNWKNKEEVLEKIDRAPEPKRLMVTGSCTISEGAFLGSKNISGPVDELREADLYIPGCPVSPESMMDGLKQLVDEIKEELEEGGADIEESKGINLERQEDFRGEHIHDKERCIYCGKCAEKCPSASIIVEKEKEEWKVDLGRCLFCGRCKEVCPVDAISFSNNFEMAEKDREELWSKGNPGKGT